MYRLNQLNIPLGTGIKYELSGLLNVRLEWVYHILFTDYLDDVSNEGYADPSIFRLHFSPQQAALARQLADRRSLPGLAGQRGNPKNNDAFFVIQLKLGFIIRSARR